MLVKFHKENRQARKRKDKDKYLQIVQGVAEQNYDAKRSAAKEQTDKRHGAKNQKLSEVTDADLVSNYGEMAYDTETNQHLLFCP